MQLNIVARAAALCLLASAGASHAVSFNQGDVNLDINGTVNGFYVNREAKITPTGGVESKTTNSSISNGLLPGWINFVATAKAGDQDVKAHFGFAPGVMNNSTIVGLPSAGSAFPQIDTRNLYFQFGNDSWGRVKLGRDIGLFGQNIVLSDMTLLGVGGTANAAMPFNTTFGMIGHGYMYTGFQPQITYSSPKLGGLQASAGIFQPSAFAGNETKTPGVQAMASFDFAGAAPGKVWAGLVNQGTQCSTATCTNAPHSASGYELGAKAGLAGFEGVLYTFKGKGLGLSTIGAQFLGGGDAAGNKTDSKGFLAQVTYKIGDTKLGVNYGKNTDEGGGTAGVFGAAKNDRKAVTFGVYHSLNKYITLVGELNQEKQTNAAASEKDRTLSLGGIMFF
jgi:Gram-negative porin